MASVIMPRIAGQHPGGIVDPELRGKNVLITEGSGERPRSSYIAGTSGNASLMAFTRARWPEIQAQMEAVAPTRRTGSVRVRA